MSDSQDETEVQPAVGEDGRPRSGGSGQRARTSTPSGGSGAARGSANGRTTPTEPAKKAAAPAQKRPASSPRPASGQSGTRAASSGSASRTSSGSTRAESGRTLTAADYARTTRGSADQTSVIPAIADGGSGGSATPGRQARLRLNHVEPWSVTRLAFLVSVLMMIVAFFAVIIFWIVLDVTGVWDQLNGSVTNVLADDSGDFDLTDYLGLGRIAGLTLVLSAVNVIVFTALATIGAHLYNLGAQLLGGIEVTFSDD